MTRQALPGLDAAADKVGSQYGMTASQGITHLAIGEIPHANAPATDCGMTDPRDDTKWCRRAPGHTSNHCNWPDEDQEAG